MATSELNQMLPMLLKAQKLTEEHKVLAQQKAEERAIAEKRATEKQKAEEVDAKVSANN